MNTQPDRDILSGPEWEQAKGQIKQWWDKLTDADLNRINGNTPALIEVIAQRYGYTKEQADREVAKFMEQFRVSEEKHDQAT